ncbi:MAG TPA: hypothetical protein VMR65_08425, partial [Candidatus Sulfotelmatobacter sp.]|nr:hypothetical protein [Candidatus Sulfotelmatobacter sp.]
RQVIRGLAGEQTVVLSTHILPEVQMTCSRVVIINEGQVVAEDSIENLTAGLGRVQSLHVRVARETDGLAGALAALPGVTDAVRSGEGTFRVRVDAGDSARERVAAEVVRLGAGLIELSRERASLEEVFLKLVTDDAAGAAA